MWFACKRGQSESSSVFHASAFWCSRIFSVFCRAEKFFLRKQYSMWTKRVFLLSQKVPFFLYPPDSCQIICFAVSELQPTFISILDVYQRNDPVSAMQDYSSSFILNSARKKDPRTAEKGDVHSDKLLHRYTRINPI